MFLSPSSFSRLVFKLFKPVLSGHLAISQAQYRFDWNGNRNSRARTICGSCQFHVCDPMNPVWVCLEILDDFYFMKGIISYIVTSFAFGICLSEVWALKEILEAHYFGLIRSSSSNWSNFTVDRKFTCVPLIWPFVHSVRFTLVIVQSTLFIYCFQRVISKLRSFFRSRIICDSVLWLPAADTSNHRRQYKLTAKERKT